MALFDDAFRVFDEWDGDEIHLNEEQAERFKRLTAELKKQRVHGRKQDKTQKDEGR